MTSQVLAPDCERYQKTGLSQEKLVYRDTSLGTVARACKALHAIGSSLDCGSAPAPDLIFYHIYVHATSTIGHRKGQRHGVSSDFDLDIVLAPGKGRGKGKGKGKEKGKGSGQGTSGLRMGNEESSVVSESTILSARDVAGLAEYINSGKCKNIVVMTGAGISTSAGIPDFRSPETGLYANLARLKLPYAEAVFDISYFRQNPVPFYTLAQELYPGKYRPTITHSFIRLLYEKTLLLKHFTQNIDCLDREAGVPGSHIIEAHGSFAEQSCIDCKEPYPPTLMDQAVKDGEPAHCLTCHGLVKPEIVFFGEALPAAFFAARDVPSKADLAIVIGTSLTVQPFASLPNMIPDGVPRVLINLERAGGLGNRPDDVLLLGDCDTQVRKLAEACGWLDELEELWKFVGGKVVAIKPRENKERTDESVSKEMNALGKEIDRVLSISYQHQRQAHGDLPGETEEHLAGDTEDGEGKGPQLPGKDLEKAKEEGDSHAKTEKDASLNHVFPHMKSNLS